MIGAGSLNKRVNIQVATQAATTRSASGTKTWADGREVWAAIWPTAAREVMQAQQLAIEITHRIRIRFRLDVSAANRISYYDHRAGTTRYFKIKSVLNWEEKNMWLDLICEEVVES